MVLKEIIGRGEGGWKQGAQLEVIAVMQGRDDVVWEVLLQWRQ